MFWAEIWKIFEFFVWKFSIFRWLTFQYIWIGMLSNDMRTIKVKVSLRILPVSPEPMLFAHIGGRLRETFSQRPRHVALLKGRAYALKNRSDEKSKESFSSMWLNYFHYTICTVIWFESSLFEHAYLSKYSITSMARIRVARLPGIIRTLFSVPTKSFQ